MYRQSRLTLILPLIVLFAGGCKKWFEDEELTLPKTPYTGDELRTDGYYYHTSDGNYYRTITFFYADGVAFQPLGGFHSLQETDEYIINELVGENRYHDVQFSWKLYNIVDERILINYWVPPGAFQCYFQEGTILNDTTFVIQSYYRMKKGEKIGETEINETYHFHQFSPKPDSTNIFIQ